MRITEFKDKRGRRALTCAILSTKFLSRMASVWKPEGLFLSSWENLVGKWCVDYYKDHSKAPRKNIQGLFESWENKNQDPDTASIVQKFLASLSEDFEGTNGKINSKYEIEQARLLFVENETKSLITKLQGALDTKKEPDGIEQIVREFKSPNLSTDSEDIDLFNDPKAWDCMFKEKEDTLITYPGALGDFYGYSLSRGNFISFCGPEKRGKTFQLLDIAFRGLLNRKRVAFFEVGDMTREQISRRFAVRACEHPWRPKEVSIPIGLQLVNGLAIPQRRTKVFTEHLQLKILEEGCAKLRDRIKSSKTLFKMRVYPASTLTVGHLRNICESWARDGWVPDIVVIDYADLLAQSFGKDVREKINEIWIGLRALSQTLNCLVVTATQANRAAYNVRTIEMEHTSEDKRKLSHITGMIGLNCTKEEKEEGVLRLNWVALREDDFNPGNSVHVSGCLALADPNMVSCWDRPPAHSLNNPTKQQ